MVLAGEAEAGSGKGIGGTTVERWFQDFLQREAAERRGAACPRILGIDEHFFSRKDGYATTFCDLRTHTIFDVVLGRSEASLEEYLAKLPGRDQVRIVCMDLCSVYRAVVRKYFPNAKIVADRFHVVRLINHHFLACWREIDPVGAKHRGLLSLMRRHQQNLKPAQRDKLEKYLDQFPVLR
jgi:transposase